MKAKEQKKMEEGNEEEKKRGWREEDEKDEEEEEERTIFLWPYSIQENFEDKRRKRKWGKLITGLVVF